MIILFIFANVSIPIVSIQFKEETVVKNTEAINKLVWFIEEEIEELVEK